MIRIPSVGRRLGPFLVLLAFLVGSGCEDGSLNAPEIQDGAAQDTALFSSYVALGNSITAGFQSNGIARPTQEASFAAILADSMNTPFGIPALASPGCPPPLTQFFNDQGIPDPQWPSGTDGETCALREAQQPDRVNNVAVPGARVLDALSNTRPRSRPNPLTQFILGGRTQVEAARAANPTFATVWLGNNDVLGPALAGTDDLTSFSSFARNYTQVLDQLTNETPLQGGVLIGVANVTFLPFFSPGPVYAALAAQGQFPDNFNVASSCETQSNNGLTPLVSISYGFGLLGLARANPNQTVTLDCAAADTPVLTLDEVESIVQSVRQYNAFIQKTAQRRGLAYFNPNPIFRALYTNDDGDQDPTNDLIPKFPDRDSEQPFGDFFSLDGVHPSAVTHRVVAARLTQTINDTYDTGLAPPSNVPSLPGGSGAN